MQTFIGIIIIAIFAGLTLGQPDRPPPPINCTKTFDHSYSLDELLEEFRDDDIRNNMRKAARVFWSHPDLTIEYIYSALNHEDWQVRQVIAFKIWNRLREKQIYRSNPRNPDGSWNGGYFETVPGDADYPVTEDLVRVTIEGLKDDTTPHDRVRRRGLLISNANLGTSILIPIAHQWSDLLIEAMESDDGQQRFLAAYILGRAGVAQSVERAAEILLPHLRDNYIQSDANFSVYALGGFGTELEPILRDTLPSADQQQRSLIMLLLLNIRDPAITKAQQAKRLKYNSITTTRPDPTQSPSKDSWIMLNHFEFD
tara:strand:+ start:172069 stop:173007 length:939 start_codon:yes stop_codon:yes gene_type:complete